LPAEAAATMRRLPATIAGFASTTAMPSWATSIVAALGHGQQLYMVLYAALIAFFALFYTAIVFNPKDKADNLKKHGGF
ncbi:preprotein translocase subunit SecY, partial [Rhizobium leguminosarum]